MEIILIAALAANNVIGSNNTIPWHIPGEQKRFKEITMGHCLIMGRKTWQSIGRPLPGRHNIVVTRNTSFTAPGAEVVHSLEQGIAACRGDEKIFIIGGEQLYRLALGLADTLILTMLDHEVIGDACSPEFSCHPFTLVHTETITSPVSYSIQTFCRKKALPGINGLSHL
jgi:dihydrofolate reductase